MLRIEQEGNELFLVQLELINGKTQAEKFEVVQEIVDAIPADVKGLKFKLKIPEEEENNESIRECAEWKVAVKGICDLVKGSSELNYVSVASPKLSAHPIFDMLMLSITENTSIYNVELQLLELSLYMLVSWVGRVSHIERLIIITQ